MDDLLKNRKWYLKSSAKNPCVQGPYSTECMLRFLEKGRLKDRVCLSADQKQWVSLKRLSAGPFPMDYEKILLKAIRHSEKMLKRMFAILLTTAIVFSFAFLWQKTRPVASSRVPEQNNSASSSQSCEVKIETTTVDSGEKRRKKAPLNVVNREDQKLAKEVQPKARDELTMFEEKIENLAGQKDKKVKALPQIDEKRVRTAIKQYYLHLDEITGQLSKRRDFEDAWPLFAKRVRTMDEFLQERGINVPADLLVKIRMGNKGDGRCGYFYPAFLYDNYENFLVATDSEAMAAMEKQIVNYRIQFADIIEADKKLKGQKRTLENTAEVIEKMYAIAQNEIAKKNNELIVSRKKIKETRDTLDADQKQVIKLSEKSLELAGRISKLRKKMTPMPLIGYYPGESWQQHQQKRDLQRLLGQQTKNIEEISAIQKEILSGSEKIRLLENSIPELEKEISNASAQLPTLQKQIGDVKAKLLAISRDLALHKEELKPLGELSQRKLEALQALRKTKEWWRKSYPKPRKKFLQAIYVLKTFPDKYHRIEHRTNYGKGGVVEVHFW